MSIHRVVAKMGYLNQAFEEHTVIWLLLSGTIGGIVGAFIKSLFEEIVNPKLRTRRETKRVVRRYTLPIIRAADSLQGRIMHFLSSVKNSGYRLRDDEQYFVSTLYLFGQYLGWIRILEQEMCFLDFNDSRKTRKFNIRINSVFKGFTSQYYFKDKGVQQCDVFTVRRTILSAIGELMVAGEEANAKGIIGYAEFAKKIGNDKEFDEWFEHLTKLLDDVQMSEEDDRWDRLVIIAAQLRMLLDFLDPTQKRRKKRKIDLRYLQNAVVKQKIKLELTKSGTKNSDVWW